MGILHSDLEFNLCPLNPQAIIKPRDTVERAVGIASSSDTLMANSRDNLISHSGHGPHILPLCGLLIDVTSVWAMYLPEFISGKRVRIGVRAGEKTQSTESKTLVDSSWPRVIRHPHATGRKDEGRRPWDTTTVGSLVTSPRGFTLNRGRHVAWPSADGPDNYCH